MIIFDHTTIELRDDGIIQLTTSEFFSFTIKETKEGVDAIGKLGGGKEMPVLKIAGEWSTVDGESRRFCASEEGGRFSLAEAIVIKTLAHQIIGNFYLQVEKPAKPTKLFTQVDLAINWLKTFKKI